MWLLSRIQNNLKDEAGAAITAQNILFTCDGPMETVICETKHLDY